MLKRGMVCLWLVVILMVSGAVASFAEDGKLVIPESVVEIQSQVFEGCESAEILTVYGMNTVIADDALENSGITTIRSYRAATQIREYAERNHLTWEPLDPVEGIVIWTGFPEIVTDELASFRAHYPQYALYDVTVEGVNVAEALGAISGGAKPDIFEMPQDQFYSIRNLGGLDAVPESIAGTIRARNAAGSVSAAEIGRTLYAYPLTADNGYFLYYDRSVVSDPSSLDAILRDCEAAGKNFYMEVDSGWYQIAYFFGAGCWMDFSFTEEGNLESVDIAYANDHGIQAMRSLIQTVGSPCFMNGSSVNDAENWAAIVSGTWDARAAMAVLGDNYAASKLPEIDGYQMKSFGGFKLMGVRPQQDTYTQELCHALADWLTDERVQLRRYSAAGDGPSNLAAQRNEALRGDVALTALAEQSAYAVPQGQIPGGYWDLSRDLVREIMEGNYTNASDAQLMDRLQQFEEEIRSLVQ